MTSFNANFFFVGQTYGGQFLTPGTTSDFYNRLLTVRREMADVFINLDLSLCSVNIRAGTYHDTL